MSRTRLVIGAAGIAVGLYGAVHLLLSVGILDLVALLLWMVAAVALHDGVIAPLTLAAGAALTALPPRARKYVQGALLAGALVTVVALPLLALRGSQPAVKAILRRNYAGGLALLLALIAAVALVRYLARVLRDARDARITPPPAEPED